MSEHASPAQNGDGVTGALVRGAAAAIVLAATGLPLPSLAQEAPLKSYSKAAKYEDVKFELQNAIVERGLTVDFNGQIGNMLARTGADVGSARPIYKQAEYFTFCSAKLSRQMMEADPTHIGFCPYVVFIYETVAAPGRVHVGYRRLPRQGQAASQEALLAIDGLLDQIAAQATK